jgi:hypothetical protein
VKAGVGRKGGRAGVEGGRIHSADENEKVIDKDQFRELIGELDLERAMGESATSF